MEDQDIIHLYVERSQQAIIATKRKYGAYCRAIAHNILTSAADVEECENDTYFAAWNTIPPTIPRKLSVFLGRITRNIALDKYSYNKAKKRNRELEMILTELEGCVAAVDTVETVFIAGELAQALNQFLYSVDEQERNLFVRRYWYTDSIKQLADRFHMSSSKVKSMLFRTRNKLYAHLVKEGFIDEKRRDV